MKRYESTGAADASFVSPNITFAQPNQLPSVSSLAVQPDGKVVFGGNFDTHGSASHKAISRANADGSVDASFTPPVLTGFISKVLIQPNNRILVGGNYSSSILPNFLGRLLPSGQTDTSFGNSVMPNGNVSALLVQPDGRLVAGGSFTSLGAQPIIGVGRIVASNVLAVAAPAAVVAATQAWPVPAHEQLNVQTDASAHAQTLDLLDVLGRPVQHVELRAGTTAALLSCDKLPAGTYLLRVNYTEGMVTRRVQVQ